MKIKRLLFFEGMMMMMMMSMKRIVGVLDWSRMVGWMVEEMVVRL